MKEYPKTYGLSPEILGRDCISFQKLDGSNLRFEYSRKSKRWYKFGTRRRLFDKSDPDFGSAIDLFSAKYGEALAKIFHDTKEWKGAEYMVAFAEFLGPHSFSGIHDPVKLKVENNDPKDLILFDLDVHRRGLISPREFVKRFEHLHAAEVVYDGPLTQEFFNEVRNGGKFKLNEGVMCKGGSGHDLWMCKIKTLEYLDRLKTFFGNNWQEYWEEKQ
jgi:hypothetical protein